MLRQKLNLVAKYSDNSLMTHYRDKYRPMVVAKTETVVNPV